MALDWQALAAKKAWKAFESEHGDESSVSLVQEKMPRVMKKRREMPGGDGLMEEYYDLVFPEEEAQSKPASKLLQLAHAWAAQKDSTGA